MNLRELFEGVTSLAIPRTRLAFSLPLGVKRMKFSAWLLDRYGRISQACGVLVILIGTGALIGWFANSTTLKGIRSAYIPMAPNTALVFLLFGACLTIVGGKSFKFLYIIKG